MHFAMVPPSRVPAMLPLNREWTERLREMCYCSPYKFSKLTSSRTLKLAAKASFEEALTEKRLFGEIVRSPWRG